MSEKPSSDLPLSEDVIHRLLGLGLAGTSEIVQSLCCRLGAPDGEEWFAHSVELVGVAAQPDSLVRLSLDSLVDLKQRSKSEFAAADDHEGKLRAILVYFVAVALAISAHDQNSSSRSPEELARSLAAIAEVLPASWAEVFGRAVVRLDY